MKKNLQKIMPIKVVLLILLATFFITSSAFLYADAIINQKAPHFTLKDHKGNSHKLSDYKGKIVVLEWINFDCPFVKKHYQSKNMQNLQKEFTQKKVIWLSICSSKKKKGGYYSTEAIEKKIQSQASYQTAYLIDAKSKVGKKYQAKTTPHMFIIDKNGALVYDGAIDSIRSAQKKDIKKAKNYVKLSLNSLLEGKKPLQQKTVPYGCRVKY